ncbi:MAG: LacI family DNA-binding transcriptional regulator [Maritimibacter sp.]|nr:LacI family DNA-binding transcriptional regulator [Maritimibacter sp.]
MDWTRGNVTANIWSIRCAERILAVTDDTTVPPKRPLTLRDVSEASGVSEMTVSRVLRNRGDVSEATREKVLEAAKELGYVPNKIAGALASQRVNLVAVIIPSLGNMVFPEVMTSISEVLDNTPLQPVVGVTNYLPEREEKVLYEMLSWRPSGVIIAGLEHSDASKAMLRGAGIPVVEIMDTDGTPIDSVVGISHRRAGRMMAETIVKAGYRRIGFLGTKMSMDHRARKRFEGFTEALAKAGLEVTDQEFYEGGSSLQKGREMTAAMLERSPKLDFLYFSNDMIGAGGLLHCVDAGYDVPNKLGMAGFNDIPLLRGLSRRLATMDSSRAEIGRRAAEIIAARVEAGDEGMAEGKGERVELTPTINRGDTLRKRPAEAAYPE